MSKENQDYYKVAGRSPGPAGPLKQFKRELTRSRASVERAGKGKKNRRRSATERAEADLSAVERHSALDWLPKPVGAAGMKASRKPAGPVPGRRVEAPAGSGDRVEGDGGRLGDTPPADYGLAAHQSVPYETRDAGERAVDMEAQPHRAEPEVELPSFVLRAFGPAFRVAGRFASLVDRPVRTGLDTLRRLGRAATPK